MSLSAIVQAMADAGCSPQQIAAAVRAHEEAAPVRSKHAEAQAKYRAKKNAEKDNAVITRDHGDHKQIHKECPHTPIETTSLTNVRDNSSAREADFVRVREAYPKRAGGDPAKTARKAFEAALKRGADPETIVAGAAAFAKFRAGDDPKFTPMLATWLNRDGWTDDYSSPPSRAGPQPRMSNLAKIAMGVFDDGNSAYQPTPTVSAEPGNGGIAGPVPEQPGTGRGSVVDLRRSGSGWR